VKQLQLFEVDLTRIHGGGDFLCPKCEIVISPEDETEQVYSIQEIKVRNEILEEVIIQCNNCGSRILLTGFSKFCLP
jgi:DNA-directed RNA polymerase subunit RPC12/RpoP